MLNPLFLSRLALSIYLFCMPNTIGNRGSSNVLRNSLQSLSIFLLIVSDSLTRSIKYSVCQNHSIKLVLFKIAEGFGSFLFSSTVLYVPLYFEQT